MDMGHDVRNREESQDVPGQYADVVQVGFNAYRFVLEFGQLSFYQSNPEFHSRIIMGPDQVKALLSLLSEAVSTFDYSFGPITKKRE
jgi:Protein of unknown function (DUF3467)